MKTTILLLAALAPAFAQTFTISTLAQPYAPIYSSGVAVDSAGNVYYDDQYQIKKMTPSGAVSVIAGTGIFSQVSGGDGGTATAATFRNLGSLAVDAQGNVYAFDYNRVRRIGADGTINAFVGQANPPNPVPVFTGGSVPASSYYLPPPPGPGLAIDAAGNLLIAHNDWVVKSNGTTVTAVAGGGAGGNAGDGGPALGAGFSNLVGVTTDASGNIYVAAGPVVRKITTDGKISTVAGSPTSGLTLGDGGSATSAGIQPYGLATDKAGNLYITDNGSLVGNGSGRIRKVTGGIITTIAGGGANNSATFAGNATDARLAAPAEMAADSNGNLYFMTIDGTLRKLTASGGSSSGAGTPAISSVVGGASFQPGVVPGAWITITGTNFAPAGFTDTWDKAIVNGKLPTSLDGVSVSVGGQPAYVNYVSATQINAVAPNVGAGSAQVTVTANNGTSAPFNTTVSSAAPAFFLWVGKYAVATHVDGTWAVKNGTFAGTTTVPAKPGEYVVLWGTGFGAASPPPPAGTQTPADQIYASGPVTATVNGAPAAVYNNSAALAPGFAGLYQLAVQIPASAPDGDLPIVATVAGAQSPASVLITVQH